MLNFVNQICQYSNTASIYYVYCIVLHGGFLFEVFTYDKKKVDLFAVFSDESNYAKHRTIKKNYTNFK